MLSVLKVRASFRIGPYSPGLEAAYHKGSLPPDLKLLLGTMEIMPPIADEAKAIEVLRSLLKSEGHERCHAAIWLGYIYVTTYPVDECFRTTLEECANGDAVAAYILARYIHHSGGRWAETARDSVKMRPFPANLKFLWQHDSDLSLDERREVATQILQMVHVIEPRQPGGRPKNSAELYSSTWKNLITKECITPELHELWKRQLLV